MKKTITSFLFLPLTSFVSTQLYAQQRSIDMVVNIESPSEGTYSAGQSVPLTVSVTNNGPDSIRVGDTLFVIMPDGNPSWGMMTEAVPVGGTTELFTNQISMPDVEITETFDLCVQLVDDPSSSIKVNGAPFTYTYIDPNPSNNLKCNKITIEASTSTITAKPQTPITLQFIPNPALSTVRIPIQAKVSNFLIIVFRDLVGRTIMRMDLNTALERDYVDVDLSTLREGLYLVELQSEQGSLTGKLAVGHLQ